MRAWTRADWSVRTLVGPMAESTGDHSAGTMAEMRVWTKAEWTVSDLAAWRGDLWAALWDDLKAGSKGAN